LAAVLMVGSLLTTLGALAQSQQPYGGLQSRPIKALSEEQIADLREGRGMGFALAAELNGYPGPLHVLEHAEALALTTSQRTRMEQLLKTMQTEAVELGRRLIAEEAELDRLFATRRVTAATMATAVGAAAQTQARLRATHLRYHLLTAEALSAEQIRRYAALRGYSGGAPAGGHQRQQHR